MTTRTGNMLIATWNLNNRVGKTRFRHDAVGAIAALQADIAVLSDYYPRQHHQPFCTGLESAGYPNWLVSDNHGEVANRIIIASRFPIEQFPVQPPTFDRQFPSNILSVSVPSAGIRLLGIRVPAYRAFERERLYAAWDWFERTLGAYKDAPMVALGDLNADPTSAKARGGEYLRRILQNGWHRATPAGGVSFFGSGNRRSEIDHIGNAGCSFTDVRYVISAGEFKLAGAPDAISDHAALLANVTINGAT